MGATVAPLRRQPWARALLTPCDAARLLAAAARRQQAVRRGGAPAGPLALPGRLLGELYSQHEGLREVLEDAGGLRRLVERHGPAEIFWRDGGLALQPLPEAAAAWGVSGEGRDLSPADAAAGIAAVVRCRGGSITEECFRELCQEDDAFARVVLHAGGPQSFVERHAGGQLVWRPDGRLQLAARLLAEAVASSGGQLSAQQLAALRATHGERLEEHLRFVEAPPTGLERAARISEYSRWRKERMAAGSDPEGKAAASPNWWYAEACLVCLQHCPVEHYPMHVTSAKHVQMYRSLGGLELRPGCPRPQLCAPPTVALPTPTGGHEAAAFLAAGAFAGRRLLVLGEADFSFSLRVAQFQMEERGAANLVATSFLRAHDPCEPEVSLSQGMAVWHHRQSLSAMGGALAESLAALESLGAQVLHGVDATDLEGTLLRRGVEGTFDAVVFPFPQASPCSDPRNPALVRSFFRNVGAVLPRTFPTSPGMRIQQLHRGRDYRSDHSACSARQSLQGAVQLVLLASQYTAWDVECLAAEASLELTAAVKMPEGFYRSRVLVGRAWAPKEAVLLTFRRQSTFGLAAAGDA